MKRATALVTVLVLTLAACGGGDGDEAVSAAPVIAEPQEDQAVSTDAAPEPTTAVASETDPDAAESTTAAPATEATDEERAIEFAQCMRDNGFPDWPDPTVNADGSIELVAGGAQQAGIDLEDGDLDAALDACGDIIAGASFLPGADLDQSEIEDSLLAFAQCLRDLGHDVADPDLSGQLRPGPDGPGGMFASGFDPQDPANAADVQTCQTEAFGASGFGGAAGGN